MNIDYPHDIKRLPNGEPAPEGYAPITEKEAELLDGRSPDERAAWLKERMAAMDERFRQAGRSGKP